MFSLLVILLFLNSVQTDIYQSAIHISDYYLEFKPADDIELISTFNSESLISCTQTCNLNPQCRTCDYNSNNHQCRLFEGELSTGQYISSQNESQVASLIYNPELYVNFNKTCACCDANRYLICVNNSYTCPEHTYWNGEMCVNEKYAGASCQYDFECRKSEIPLICVQVDGCLETGYSSSICALNITTIAYDNINIPSQPFILYSFNFTAMSKHIIITFSFYNNDWFSLDDVSVVDKNDTELILDGGFENDLIGWNYCNPWNTGYGGTIGVQGLSSPHNGLKFYFDGAWAPVDYLSQMISTKTGFNYTLSFWLANTGSSNEMRITLFQ